MQKVLATVFLIVTGASLQAHARYLPLCFDKSAAVRSCLLWQDDPALKSLSPEDPELTLVDNHSERGENNEPMRFTGVAYQGHVICENLLVSVSLVPGTNKLTCSVQCNTEKRMPKECIVR
jgi:hypothetical protein